MQTKEQNEIERLRSQVGTLEQLLQAHEDTALQQARRLEKVVLRLEAKSNEVTGLNRELEARVEERTAQLRLVVQELEGFCYSVSHDLRAPLRTLDGFSQALLEDYHDKLDAEGRNYLERIRVNTQRLGVLMDALLQLSRLTRKDLITQDCALSEIASQIVAELQKAEPERDVKVQIAPQVYSRGDPAMMQVLLTNLLNNAFKFTRKTQSPQVEFGVTHEDGNLCCFVRDNGVGFDMQYSSKLFGAFQRLHHPKDFDGTGIGLATVHRVVARHKGRIWGIGSPGAGATFYFTLPGLEVRNMKECA